MSEIKLTIKFSNADKFEVTGCLSDTVIEFKNKISSNVNVPSTQQRLIHKGKVLKDDLTLESYEIHDGDTIHLVKGVTPSSTNQSTGTSRSTTTSSNINLNTTSPPVPPNNPLGNSLIFHLILIIFILRRKLL